MREHFELMENERYKRYERSMVKKLYQQEHNIERRDWRLVS